MQTLERHAYLVLADMPVDEIGREDVLRALTPIWGTRMETVRRVRQRIRTVLAWAQAHGYIAGDNATGEGIADALPTMPTVKQHYRALPYGEVGGALDVVEASKASVAAKLALRFLVLTATRSGEVRNAGWSKVDMDAREWRIPASRMKAGVEHCVPLNAAATGVLERARMLDDGSGLIFPSPARRGRAMSDMTLPTRRTHPRSGAARQRPAPFSARRCRVRFPRMGRCTESGTAGTVAVKLCG